LADPRHFDFSRLRATAFPAMTDTEELELARHLEPAAVAYA
jgi:hypothetical protein